MKKKRIMIGIICIATFGMLLGGCGKSVVPDMAEENHLMTSDGYYLDVYTSENKDQERTGELQLSSVEEEMYMVVQNAGKARKFVIKMLLDYKEIPFQIEDEEYTTYILDSTDHENITIPFVLIGDFDSSVSHKLTISLIAGEDVNASTVNQLSEDYGVTINYTLAVGEAGENQYDHISYTDVKQLEGVMYSGVMINLDFEGLKDNLYPPIKLTASPNEIVELALRGGNIDGYEEYLVYTLVGWEQEEMSGEPYILFKTEEERIGYQTFTIEAPSEPGLYEICAWIVPNPFGKTDFVTLDSSYRFTLEVK